MAKSTRIKRSSARGKRGQALEQLIEYSCRQYELKGIARIDKVPTPMKSYRGKTFYEKKSTVDFIGTIRGGITVAFDAKQTNVATRFDIGNETHVQPHQMDYLRQVYLLGGFAFFIIEFSTKGEQYLLPYAVAKRYKERGLEGGRKSIAYEEFKTDPQITQLGPGPGIALDFLKPYIRAMGEME